MIRSGITGAMPAHQIDNEDPSECSSSSDESSSAETRFTIVHEPDLEIESSPDPSSEELGIISNLSSDAPDQISRSSSVSRSTSRSLSDSAHSQMPNTSKGAASITEWGPPNLRRLTSIRSSQLRYPKSQYCNYVPPLPICYEKYAVNDLLEAHAKQKLAEGGPCGTASLKQDFLEFELSEFVVYLPDNRHHPFEIWSLQDLASKNSCSTLLFDGILRVGDVRRYVQAVPFNICSVGNYGEDIHDVGDNIWIRSTLLAKSDIYYRLKSPAPEYARFYQGFLWLANLAKHFVDYCQWSVDKRMQVSVFNFRTKFSHWLQRKHGMSSSFQSWYKNYINDDFRHAVAANIHFLFKESIGIEDKLRNLTIWNELLEKDIVPVQKLKESMTIVTPYVYDCFRHLRFGHLLKSVVPKYPEQKPNNLHIKAHFLPVVRVPHERMSEPLTRLSDISKSHSVESQDTNPWDKRDPNCRAIRVGDVLSVTKDGENSVWKDEATQWKAADVCWYLYVQGVYESKNGKQSFAGIWLYKSSDTCCAKMKYPYPNELFLSDNCTCSHGRIQEDEVLDKVTVEWHGSPSTSRQGFFVRQTYLENEKFESLKEEHKTCEHLKQREKSVAQTQKFPIGQTVLVHPPEQKPKHALEPYEIIMYIEDGTKRLVVLKHLLRRNEIAGQAGHRRNELVYSGRTHQVEMKRIECTCLVRFYSEADVTGHTIPTPYDRDGTGNAFYITTRLIEQDGSQTLEPIEYDLPRTLIQGFDPTEASPHKLLRGLDLYCGGGNFGRGLEEGGALHNEWAVDYAKTPMHSYYANLKEPSGTKLFCGSVDDQLYQALCGNPKRSDLIPLPGEVDFISAGSPCQGFSALNLVRNNNKGLKNQSLVASVAAYIDFYRPKYGLLENVMTMAQKGLGRDEDVLSQLICAIVGMGYQLQLFVLDAWSLGSPQSRSRLFVSFAAPGYPPLEHPQLSHSHPANIKSRGLGKLANGQSFGHRIHCPTPFEYVTASDATTDLPDIGDGQTYQCTPLPDHVMTIKPSTDLRSQMAVIPTYPQGSSFVSAWKEGNGVMTKEQRALFPSSTSTGKTRQCVQKTSKAWGRVHPRRLFPTIVVKVYPMDARMGTCLHWEQQRILTVMEARRAQGFPDREVLVGSAAEKWKVIGNSVPRTVSLALGLSLRNAWLKCLSHQEPNTVEIETRFTLPATKTNVNEISRAQLSHKETILRSHDNIPNESNVGRHLGPRPLISTTRIFRHNKTITTSNARPGRNSPVGQPENIQTKTKVLAAGNSLKRQHCSIQEASILTAEKRHKALKLSALGPDPSSSSMSSHERAESRYLTGHFTNPSGLSKRSDVFLNRVAVQRRESLEDRRLIIPNSESESIDEDEKDEEGTMSSVVSRMTQSGMNGAKRLSSGESQCHIFINLDTDTEDNTSPDSVVSGQNIIRSPQPKFVHSHNDKAEWL